MAYLKTIESNAFENCVALEELEIPDSVEKIESGAFNYCASLKHVRLPKSLKDLGTSAFSSCNIKSVELPKEFTPWNDDIRKYRGFENCEEVATY
ncbi:MAG: leucine-rich repeat domain-containing protein [Paludibacteraceae bacterium]|nr:leucine-rich repeat domain-containing protein [Paludibacteraceae bacterium]